MKRMNKVLAIAGIVCGIATIIIGVTLLKADCGSWQETGVSFGADFYTYSYKASARAANNVQDLAKILRSGLSYLLMTLGAFEALYFGNMTLKAFESAVPAAVPQEETPALDADPDADQEEMCGSATEETE